MALEDYSENIDLCLKCGACLFGYHTWMPSCPSGERYGFMPYYARGRMDMAYGLLTQEIGWSDKLKHILYSCTDCKTCENVCTEQTSVKNLDIILEMKNQAVDRGSVPSEIRFFLENVYKYGNPYAKPRRKRDEWAVDMNIKQFSGQEYLLYVGCVGSYDDVGQRSAKAFTDILLKCGFSFGILGKKENCDGNEVNRLGEAVLFEDLAEKNVALFKELGVTKIVALSPHAYNAIKNDYPQFGGNFEVNHASQLLINLIQENRIEFSQDFKSRVTYHDPCWLGRRNSLYEEPREILSAVPGLELVEMKRNKAYSFCCGGGGGNFYSDMIGSGHAMAPGRRRVREALETGAEILAVACPTCAVMLEAAIKSERAENRLVVKDVSEIVNETAW